jgi:hypothetical protein
MTNQTADPGLPVHGGTHLPSVEVDSYNIETRDNEGFIGDRITQGAFRDVIDDLRKVLRKKGEDPLGDDPTEDLSKKTLDKLLAVGEPDPPESCRSRSKILPRSSCRWYAAFSS